MDAKKIVKIPYVDYFEMSPDDVDKIENDSRQKWAEIFAGIKSGRNNIAWWGSDACRASGLVYALHRSTKAHGFLQLSVAELHGGDLVPCGDAQYNDLDSFILDMSTHCDINVNVA